MSHYSFAVPCRPADGSPRTTVAQSSANSAWGNTPHKACFKGSNAPTDVFLVITAKCILPIFSFWQQKKLCELTKEFSYTKLGVDGPVIQVYGDMLPSSDFCIIVQRAREVPDIITASEFIHACHKLWALSVQLQLGQSAPLDTSGILYTMLQCCTAQNDGLMAHNPTQDNALLQIRSSPCSASNPVAALTLQHGAASACLLGQSQCSSLLNYLQSCERVGCGL